MNDDADFPGCGPTNGTSTYGSQVAASVTAGVVYYVQVGAVPGVGRENGTFTLTAEYVTAAANNDFNDAITFTGASVSGSNFAATLQAGEYNANTNLQSSVWFRFTAVESGAANLNICDAQMDSILIVWEDPSGLPLTSDTPLAENDDSASCASQNPLASAVAFNVTSGRTYYVQIGNYSMTPYLNQGSFTLSADIPGAFTADQTPPTWLQSVGRSVDTTCQSDQGWLPSWEQWMNDGAGGETCYRVIAWHRGGWAVGNWSGPNGTFVPVAGATIDGSTTASSPMATSSKPGKN